MSLLTLLAATAAAVTGIVLPPLPFPPHLPTPTASTTDPTATAPARRAAAPGAAAPSAHGAWPLPAPHPVVHGFAPPSTLWGPGHRGVDLGGHVGEPVRAALAGRVTFAAVLAGRGVIVVDHGARRTTYEPVRAIVAVGDTVTKGQRIGTLTRTMSHCFPRACLHWGYLRGPAYLDPLTLVGGGPVRLLPVPG